jgi:hypothetical protein
LIPRRPTDWIINVETTSEEVTVDSPSFKSKNEIGSQPAMLCEKGRSEADVGIGRVAPTLALRIIAEIPVPRAAASIESP